MTRGEEIAAAIGAVEGADERLALLERCLDALPEATREEIRESVRVQAAEEGCRWSELEGADSDEVAAIAGWTRHDLAEVLREKVLRFAEAKGELDLLLPVVDSGPVAGAGAARP